MLRLLGNWAKPARQLFLFSLFPLLFVLALTLHADATSFPGGWLFNQRLPRGVSAHEWNAKVSLCFPLSIKKSSISLDLAPPGEYVEAPASCDQLCNCPTKLSRPSSVMMFTLLYSSRDFSELGGTWAKHISHHVVILRLSRGSALLLHLQLFRIWSLFR